jgi:AAA+ superfamily predicted ATPase
MMANPESSSGHPHRSTIGSFRNSGSQDDINGLLPLLHWLDQRLALVEAATESDAPNAPALPNQAARPPAIALRPDSALAWLQRTFELSDFDLMVVVIAIAPELDRRYERVYAYLQNDARCQRPSVDLVLTLLCDAPAEKLARRAHFAANAPLVRQSLVQLVTPGPALRATLLAQEVQLDEQVVNLLLSQPGLDRQLQSFCRLLPPSEGTGARPEDEALLTWVTQHWQAGQPLRLYFAGVDRAGKRRQAAAISATLQVPLLIVDLARWVAEKATIDGAIQRILREAWFQGALLYVDDLDSLQTPEQQGAYQSWGEAIAADTGIVILAGTQPYMPMANAMLGVLSISFTLPNAMQRRELWRSHLQNHNIAINAALVPALSDRFHLTADQIGDAVVMARHQAQLRAAGQLREQPIQPSVADLLAAARSQAGQDLASLARKIPPTQGWADIVLPLPQLTLLQELCQEAQYQALVWEEWGFAEKLSLGKGLNVLFSGPPGTGKTLAASVIAHELGLDLYQIDLSQMVSKYIGETEKNLNRVFTAAANSNAILLFDEADALFGKRSEVRDAHDRYANIETSYLLQKMEEYEGVAILTTNFRSNMDEAFVRRLRFIVEFVLPGPVERQRIWEQIWPERVPRGADLDLAWLAQQFELPGANIRNIALRAAFLAAGDGGVVGMVHVVMAMQREYQKMGKFLMGEQLGVYGRLL